MWYGIVQVYIECQPIFCLLAFGACYGTAKAGVGLGGMSVFTPHLVMKALLPIILAGILGIYGLIISIFISGESNRAI
jgi:V-type H+-transporting ATPase 16kDa proteolipid subunit